MLLYCVIIPTHTIKCNTSTSLKHLKSFDPNNLPDTSIKDDSCEDSDTNESKVTKSIENDNSIIPADMEEREIYDFDSDESYKGPFDEGDYWTEDDEDDWDKEDEEENWDKKGEYNEVD